MSTCIQNHFPDGEIRAQISKGTIEIDVTTKKAHISQNNFRIDLDLTNVYLNEITVETKNNVESSQSTENNLQSSQSTEIVLIVIGAILLYSPIPYPVGTIGNILIVIGIIVLVIWIVLIVIRTIRHT